MNIVIIIATILISSIIFIPVVVLIRKKAAKSKISSAESEAKRLLENANREAENIKKEEIFLVYHPFFDLILFLLFLVFFLYVQTF